MKKSAPRKRDNAPGDWRDEMLAKIRTVIEQADPDMIEERKWKKPSNGMTGVPVWSHDGIVCTGETYKNAVKVTFAHGAALKDPSGLFNASLDGNVRRAIDLHEGDKLNEKALKALIRAAVALNKSWARSRWINRSHCTPTHRRAVRKASSSSDEASPFPSSLRE